MTYEEYKNNMNEAAKEGESISLILNRHLNAKYISAEMAGYAKKYKKEIEENAKNETRAYIESLNLDDRSEDV